MRRAIFSTLHRANRPITQLVCVEWKREQGKSLLTRSSFETKCPGTEATLRKFFRPQGSTTTRTNRLTTICVARKVKTPFYHARPAAHSLRFCWRVADHSSIPDGGIPPRLFLA